MSVLKLIPGKQYKVTYLNEFSFVITLKTIHKTKPVTYTWIDEDGSEFTNRQQDIDSWNFRKQINEL